jgi:hypothetical protein
MVVTGIIENVLKFDEDARRLMGGVFALNDWEGA